MRFLLIVLLCMGTPAWASHEIEHQIHVEHWMQTLEKHPFVLIRVNAARFLGDLQDRIAVPTLIRALDDKHPDVVFASVRSLGLLGDASAIKPLYEIAIEQEGTLMSKEARRSIERIQQYMEFKKNQKTSLEEANAPTSP